MSVTVLKHVKGEELLKTLQEKIHTKPNHIYTITVDLKEEANSKKQPNNTLSITRNERNRLLDQLEEFNFGEDSEEWIENIKSSRTRSELKTPLC